MKNITDLIKEGLSNKTYSDGVDQVQKVLDNCIKECQDEKMGIKAFITDILSNLEYDIITAIKNEN